LVILDWLEDDEFAIEERKAVLSNVVAVGRMDSEEIMFGDRGIGRETIEQEGGVWVVAVSRKPVEVSRNGARAGSCTDKRASNKFSRGVGSIDRSEEMDIDEMGDEMGAEFERATRG